jgi:hypothetical protein
MSTKTEKRLLDILERLPPEQAQTLLEFAEYLMARHRRDEGISKPVAISRPEEESVVRAIQRLRITYPMLDPAKLLHETSALMSEHVMRGRGAMEVIDQLEILFRRHYERLTENEDE